MKVAVTGSSGLIGAALTASLRADGHQVVRLVRRPPRSPDELRWDPRAADAGEPALDGIGACVHLAGAGVGDHRWTKSYKAEIRASRVLATRALATALAAARPRPKVLLAASAIGWYGDTGGQDAREEDPALGEVIAVRSMVYLALTYDHRLVDGADAARFLVTVKGRLVEGAFEAELGL